MSSNEIRKRVEIALDEIRPFLQNDGGDINLFERLGIGMTFIIPKNNFTLRVHHTHFKGFLKTI